MGKLKSVGRYIMEDQTLGKGNFAVVELASHIITNTKVAIKIIDRRKLKEEYMQKNLYREAKVMNQLRHPNIVRLYETLKSSSLYFLVMEYVAGGDLLSYVRNQLDGCLTESKSRVFVRQLVSALHHLHERGVVHRETLRPTVLSSNSKDLLTNRYRLISLHVVYPYCGCVSDIFVLPRVNEYGPCLALSVARAETARGGKGDSPP
ncbi:Serine/threonine-protein kinase par-1 [Holothuria leucospilota]|uniref:non-specific serine/threonine protein kinase n=1 Tax=Holothuria leucospilota TaxID=206669 RepID=A0A9Q1BW66_HOLLE|nr:Serine/threonine-protein kinase par-1 [Holothuria leucospilota]